MNGPSLCQELFPEDSLISDVVLDDQYVYWLRWLCLWRVWCWRRQKTCSQWIGISTAFYCRVSRGSKEYRLWRRYSRGWNFGLYGPPGHYVEGKSTSYSAL